MSASLYARPAGPRARATQKHPSLREVRNSDDATQLKWETNFLIGLFFLISVGYAIYIYVHIVNQGHFERVSRES